MVAAAKAVAFEASDSWLATAIGMGLRSWRGGPRRPGKIAVLESAAGGRCSGPGGWDLGRDRTVEVPGAELAGCWGMAAVPAAAAACTDTMGRGPLMLSAAAGPLGGIHILVRHRWGCWLGWAAVVEGGIGLHRVRLAVVVEAGVCVFPTCPTWSTTLYWCVHLAKTAAAGQTRSRSATGWLGGPRRRCLRRPLLSGGHGPRAVHTVVVVVVDAAAVAAAGASGRAGSRPCLREG